MPKDFIKDLAKRPLLSESPAGQAKVPYRIAHFLSQSTPTEWQWPISGAHSNSIMMEKSALAGEGGGCTPTSFYSIYHHVQSFSVRSSCEGGYTHRISSLPVYVLCAFSRLFVLHVYKVGLSANA